MKWANRWVSEFNIDQYSRTRCSSTVLNRQSRGPQELLQQVLSSTGSWLNDTDSDEKDLHVKQDGVEQSGIESQVGAGSSGVVP